jgi:hypothetical protein
VRILLLWRKPGERVEVVATAAENAGLFASGDQVMSLEWLGDDPMPAPRWVPVTPNGRIGFTERERDYCNCAVLKRAGDRGDRPIDRDPSLLEDWTEADLVHFIFGVET